MGDGRAYSVADALFETNSDDDVDLGPKRARYEGPNLKEAIRKALGPGDPPNEVQTHIVSECKKCCAKINRSLNLLDKIERMKAQIHDLEAGRVPSGIRPHKLAVDVPELDTRIASGSASFSFNAGENCTYRELKQKVHYFFLAIGKKIDMEVMHLQVGNLRNQISKANFVEAVTAKVTSRSSQVDELMESLSLERLSANTDTLTISAARADKLYADMMHEFAIHRSKEKQRKEEHDKHVEKTIEKLKGSQPKDLLKQTIIDTTTGILQHNGLIRKKGTSDASGLKASGLNVDLAHAYSISQSGMESFEDAVEAKPPKQERQGKGKGAGAGAEKTAKGKGRGKGKDTIKKSSSRGNAQSSIFRYGNKAKGKSKTKSKKGKGKGSSWTKSPKGKGKGSSWTKPTHRSPSQKGRQKGKPHGRRG